MGMSTGVSVLSDPEDALDCPGFKDLSGNSR